MARLRTYYALAKPGIIYGNIMTAAAGFLLAAQGHVRPGLLIATLSGTALVIGSACVYNNYIDRGIDANMSRTKKRALVQGAVSGRSALIYASVLGLSGFAILLIYTNSLTASVGLFAFFTYVVLYGIAKRRSAHGTLVGSIAGAAPPVAGYVAVTNRLDLGAGLLFMLLALWQMPHFYAIAMYRFSDYKAAGIPVLPVRRGMRAAKVHILAYIAALIPVSAMLSIFGYTSYGYLAVTTLLGCLWLWRGAKGFRTNDDISWARGMFFYSLLVIMVISVMLSVDAFLHNLMYTFSMFILLHVLVALASVVYATYAYVSPSRTKLHTAYGLVALTLASGFYLVWSAHTHILEACVSGLVYIGVIALALASARHKLKLAAFSKQTD